MLLECVAWNWLRAIFTTGFLKIVFRYLTVEKTKIVSLLQIGSIFNSCLGRIREWMDIHLKSHFNTCNMINTDSASCCIETSIERMYMPLRLQNP